ncbi:2-dehydropantoate 2-reductase [Rhodococcoides fascians]|uniref:2-dehydropantoate 2-reductase n=1 Tax=Rhodococcoides fascians TaxID=1828 RepID=UPI001ABF5467|nr:2-dehydropantoate 2-reductase [Rhodococcus fascians]
MYGLGSIGGHLAARLAGAGADVSAVARGQTLEAVQRHGLRIAAGPDSDEHRSFRVPVSDDARDFSDADCVIVSVKATALPSIARSLTEMIGPGTTVLTAMNGVPWWFFHGLDTDVDASRLESIDPKGHLSAAVPATQVVGGVVHLSASVVAPGVFRHTAGQRLIIGAPGGNRLKASTIEVLRQDLSRSGFDIEVSDRIQTDVWYKLWGNMSLNPVAALTGATTDRILSDPLLRKFVSRCMLEASEVGSRLGLPIQQKPEDRLRLTQKLGAVRPSMLQDVDAGRYIELDALVGAVAEIGRELGVSTPNVDTLMGLARVHGKQHGLYPA